MTYGLKTRLRRCGAGAAALLLLAGTAACGGGNDERGERGEGKGGALGALGGRGGGNEQDDRETNRSEERRSSDRNGGNGDRGTAQIGGSEERRAGADNFDRRVRIVNNSDQTVTLVRGSPTSDRNWGADRIPTMTLSPGDATVVDFNDNNGECRYDLQATLSDGNTREQRDVNVCQVREWIITSDGSSAR